MTIQVHDRPVLSADDAWEQAYKTAITTPVWEQVEYLLDTIGSRFTAAGVGVTNARTVRRWRDEHVAPRDADEAGRVRLLFRVVHAIVGVYQSSSVAAAFLRSANPQLDDEAPIVLIAEGDPDATQKTVLAATRAFLEG